MIVSIRIIAFGDKGKKCFCPIAAITEKTAPITLNAQIWQFLLFSVKLSHFAKSVYSGSDTAAGGRTHTDNLNTFIQRVCHLVSRKQ